MLLKSEADAEDVAQEVFCKLWLQPEIWLDNERDMDDYLFIMTRNIVFNIFKHQQIEREISWIWPPRKLSWRNLWARSRF